MTAHRNPALDPCHFGELFAAALVPLCELGTDIDLEVNDRSAVCFLSSGGVPYRVTVVAEGSDQDK